MGVDTPDCGQVAKLLGTKIVLNEFIAYRTLSDLIKNRDELCTGPFISVSFPQEDASSIELL